MPPNILHNVFTSTTMEEKYLKTTIQKLSKVLGYNVENIIEDKD